MSADPVCVLVAIVSEVAGAGKPFSADSYLPAHLIHDARQAIESGCKNAAEWMELEAHYTMLLARLAKADERITSLRAEIDSMLQPAYEKPKITCQPSGSVSGLVPLMLDPLGRLGLDPDPFMRLTAYGRRQECDA